MSNFEIGTERAAALLKEGRVVAIPTETVYGLAASAFSDSAVAEIYKIKGRPQDNPLIVHVSSLEMMRTAVKEITQQAHALAREFWPGPLTIILPKSDKISKVVTCGLDNVAIRMPSHPVALAIIEKSGLPLAAPSANLSGRPSPTCAAHVRDDLDGKIPLIIDGGMCEVGVESTVITLCSEVPTILRPGIIPLSAILKILPDAQLSHSVDSELQEGEKAESPGMKYKHYSPRAEVVIVKGTLDRFAQYVKERGCGDAYALCFDGEQERIMIPSVAYGPEEEPEQQARELFASLRALDRFGASVVYARCPDTREGGLAVYNRLLRAAGFKVVDL